MACEISRTARFLHTYAKIEAMLNAIYLSGIQAAKALVWKSIVQRSWSDQLKGQGSDYSQDFAATVCHPVNELAGYSQYQAKFLTPSANSFTDLERRVDLFFAGHWDGRCCGGAGIWVTLHGHLAGRFSKPLWGIEPSDKLTYLRIGEFYRVDQDQIVEARVIVDLVDLARQTGKRILPIASGLEHLVPGPANRSGILYSPGAIASNPLHKQSFECLALVERMIGGLGRFDGDSLKSMGMRDYWDPMMMWYGPGGIGTTRTIEGFEEHHQRPFLHAIPDRKGGNHRARIGEDPFAASTGWPSIHATSQGDYLGIAASHRPVTMRVMDWWFMDHHLLKENWVLIDFPDFFIQLGVDILSACPAGKTE